MYHCEGPRPRAEGHANNAKARRRQKQEMRQLQQLWRKEYECIARVVDAFYPQMVMVFTSTACMLYLTKKLPSTGQYVMHIEKVENTELFYVSLLRCASNIAPLVWTCSLMKVQMAIYYFSEKKYQQLAVILSS